MDPFAAIRKNLREAATDPQKRPMAERILKRLDRADRIASKNPDAFNRRAKEFGVDGHDLGCLCDNCQRFWGEVK